MSINCYAKMSFPKNVGEGLRTQLDALSGADALSGGIITISHANFAVACTNLGKTLDGAWGESMRTLGAAMTARADVGGCQLFFDMDPGIDTIDLYILGDNSSLHQWLVSNNYGWVSVSSAGIWSAKG